jgi:hypothetical protein
MKKQLYVSLLLIYIEYEYGMSIIYTCYMHVSKKLLLYVQSEYLGFLIDHINLS